MKPRLFEMRCEPIDVTSMSRPNPDWRWTDSSGHVHRWFDVTTSPVVATEYHPSHRYDVPTLVFVEDYPATEEYPAVGHWECRECREVAPSPGRCPDYYRQLIPGLREYFIDGEPVSKEVFIYEREKDKAFFSIEEPPR